MRVPLSYEHQIQLVLIASALIILLLPVNSAAPIETDLKENQDQSDIETYLLRHLSKAVIDALKVLKTVIFAYIAHVMTVRSDPSTTLLPNIYKRLSALAWPTGSVYESFGVIVKLRSSNKWFYPNGTSRDTCDPIIAYSSLPTLNSNNRISSTTPFIPSQREISPFDVNPGLESTRMNQYDNIEYLKNTLDKMGPKKAKRVKVCIFNGSLYIDTNTLLISKNGTNLRLKTADMTICGLGVNCTYQLPVHPSYVRYFSKSMIDELELSSYIQKRASFKTFIAFLQLAYTVYESAYSIRGVVEFQNTYEDLKAEEKEYSHFFATFFVRVFPGIPKKIFTDRECIAYDILCKVGIKQKDVYALANPSKTAEILNRVQYPDWWEAVVILGSTFIWIMLGFWPGFMTGTITEVLVLIWIFAGFLFLILRIFLFDPSYLIGWKLYFFLRFFCCCQASVLFLLPQSMVTFLELK
ncbi:hypothetical protein J3Q64DRAFT_1697061 [Phycomyces blakesleeanus]|uniref:Uncharacterized protein n=2 Tax=Phycomyces blakesleeanus TaxID=4837 RepID=A0A167MXW0_PHYB8|nr:hypothetical protein PHYBLDRAFT_167855 [Phycomyces blakesleeanus NRRL 1555(-)]OAD74444.1 hypothetical protein PHYBLDRAFT_167855 [Phycomyces blakesleeanus NRRL 1555(-)]|eukprot:XP_018292484.1 hypothetical protein PHYBLDRAFT_167855 [Phycomyces blakesleeanus NRRL 1555(-)]